MHIRPSTFEDCSSCADIAVTAFWDDTFFNWVHPYRNQYPLAYRNFILRRHQKRYSSVGFHIFVAETDESDPEWKGQSEITGYAIYQRLGRSVAAKQWQKDTLVKKIERTLRGIESYYSWLTGADRTVSAANMQLWDELTDSSLNALPEFWKLCVLAIAPSFGRRGIGKQLLDWGLDIATKEDVPVALLASPKGQGLYLKNGFRIVGYNEWAADNIKEPVMLWEPKGLKGAWGDDTKASHPAAGEKTGGAEDNPKP
ncbi:MAG: hypothetical protein M1827_006098 [Pycnora praestabilis]|nr:MAG: hypothetical protein M1827_006098 [Pycnora praestabilis]